MTDWYYHDPAQGRVGPLTAEQMRTRYRERRILGDTLAWHRDLREWQTLEKLGDELGLDGVLPDLSQPPPMPAAGARAVISATARPAGAASRGRGRSPDTGARRGLSGCAIVAIVLAVVAIPVLGILAAIAIPAYQDYVARARVSQIVNEAEPLQQQVDRYISGLGRCPGNRSRGFGRAETYADAFVSNVQIGELAGGACAFELQFRGLGAAVDGKTLTFERSLHADPTAWSCQGGSLPPKYRPGACRAAQPE